MKTSKYQQIIDFLKEAIQDGELETGQKIPSVRQLAGQFSCSKDTVQRALLDLTYQHFLYAKPQSGYYVLEQAPDQHEDLPLKLEKDRNQAFEEFRTCINETLIGRENYLFNNFSDQAGLLEVRQSIQGLLKEESIYTTSDQIVLTAGTQQALNILSQIDFPNKKSQILIEQPTYHRMNQLLDSQQLAYRTIQRNLTGIDLEELEEIPDYTKAEQDDMYKKLLAGDESVIHTISNFWLKSVLAMAKKLAVTSEGFEDVVQEGNMGLFMCLTELCGCGDEIDVEKELLDAIEESMKECIREQTGEDESENTVVGKVSLVNRAVEKLKSDKGFEPSLSELSGYTGVDEEELEKLLELIKKADVEKNKQDSK